MFFIIKILTINNFKQFVFDCIFPIYFMILYNTMGMSPLKVIQNK